VEPAGRHDVSPQELPARAGGQVAGVTLTSANPTPRTQQRRRVIRVGPRRRLPIGDERIAGQGNARQPGTSRNSTG